jgi:hypothetical protein
MDNLDFGIQAVTIIYTSGLLTMFVLSFINLASLLFQKRFASVRNNVIMTLAGLGSVAVGLLSLSI